jgi:type IV secretory pathway VirB9-like protein
VKLQTVALALAIVAAPLVASAAPAFVNYVPVSERWFPTVTVHTGSSVDISLVPGDTLTSQAIVADPRWNMTTVSTGPQSTAHVILKPSAALRDKQLLTIPASHHDYHVLLQSGSADSSSYTVIFFEPTQKRVDVAAVALPKPTPAPKLATVAACAIPLNTKYKMSGDPRISVRSVCDDGVRTYIIMNVGRDPVPSVVPYSVDYAGHQDQLLNAVFDTSLNEWVVDGVFDRLALLTDSSRGQLRVNIERSK